MGKAFYINDRFHVRPDANLLTDKIEGVEIHLEPRHMKLLCLLAEKAGGTVTREELITAIWQDYGGGDEGLTQGISILRKLLLDQGKDLIQTIPKKGYCCKAMISYAPAPEEESVQTHEEESVQTHEEESIQAHEKASMRIRKKQWVLLAFLPVIGIGLLLFLFKDGPGSTSSPATYTKVPFPQNNDSAQQAEENEGNTIVTTGPDSTKYRLVMIGDRPPKFYVNGKPLPVDKWEPYMPMINSLKKQLSDKRNREQTPAVSKSGNSK